MYPTSLAEILTNRSKLIQFSLLLICAVIGVFTYGQGRVFDLVYLVAALVSLFVLWFDNNIKAALLVVIVMLLTEEAVFQLLLTQSIATKFVVYAAVGALAWVFKWSRFIQIMGLLCVVCVAVEIFWYVTDYEAPAGLHWHMAVLAITLFTRTMLDARPFIASKSTFLAWMGDDFTRLDRQLSKLMLMFSCVEVVSIVDYLLRHLLSSQSLMIYNAYPYVGHFLSVLCLFRVVSFTVETQSERMLKA